MKNYVTAAYAAFAVVALVGVASLIAFSPNPRASGDEVATSTKSLAVGPLPPVEVPFTCSDLSFADFGDEPQQRSYTDWLITEDIAPDNFCYNQETRKYVRVDYDTYEETLYSTFRKRVEADLVIKAYINDFLSCESETVECEFDGNDIVLRFPNSYLDPLDIGD